jgi:hypothetical protein
MVEDYFLLYQYDCLIPIDKIFYYYYGLSLEEAAYF